MTTKLKWRLSKLPDPMDVTSLVRDGIITKEEAKEILFRADDERDTDSLKEEIKFLRGLIEKLSEGKTQTIYTYVYEYPRTTWVQPYISWCASSGGLYAINSGQTYFSSATGTSTTALNMSATQADLNNSSQLTAAYNSLPTQNFSDIKTF